MGRMHTMFLRSIGLDTTQIVNATKKCGKMP